MKTCTKCKAEKGAGEFHRNKRSSDGLTSDCKACRKAYKKSRSFEPRTEGTKTCSKCSEDKPVAEFGIHKRNRDGLKSQCKACRNSRSFEPRTEGAKTCGKCGECKDVTEFNRNKGSRDGLLSWCRACINSRSFEPQAEGTKTCSRCEECKAVGEFSRRRASRNGLSSWCRACDAAYKNSRSFEPQTEGTKTCTKCGECKDVGEFGREKSRSDGLKSRCKACTAAYTAANKDKKAAYAAANKDKRNAYQTAYRAANRDKINAYFNAYNKNRNATDPRFALRQRARRAATHALNGSNAPGFFRHMPYTQDEFVTHLIATLPLGTDPAEICDGSKWHIDHIRPMASFEFEGGKYGEDWQRCWALANLRMLPAEENMAKGNSLCERPTPGECPIQDWIWETERTNKTDDDTHVDEILSNLFDTLDTGRESADTTRGNSAV